MNTLKQFPLTKPVKVLVLAKHVDGGTGTFVEQIMRLRQARIQTLVLEKPQHRNIASEEQIKYFSSSRLLPYYYVFTPSAITHLIRETLWLKKEIDIFQPNVVLTIDNHCNVLACLWKFFHTETSTRLVLTIHNNISAVTFAKLPFWGRSMFRQICHSLFAKADEIVCVSRGVAFDTKKFFSLQQLPRVIHYGVDIQNVRNLARLPIDAEHRNIFRAKSTKFLSIGRFAPQKDFRTLISAFALLHRTKPNTDLYIAGDGPDKEELVALVSTLRLKKHIHFLGWIQNVYPYIRAADIFVLSSNYEGFPYVLLEAAALGKPVVATDTPYGPREFLENDMYGLIVPMKQPRALARALLKIESHKTYVHFQDQIEERVRGFSQERMIKGYQSVIESLAHHTPEVSAAGQPPDYDTCEEIVLR